jgi:hypothetical protein
VHTGGADLYASYASGPVFFLRVNLYFCRHQIPLQVLSGDIKTPALLTGKRRGGFRVNRTDPISSRRL